LIFKAVRQYFSELATVDEILDVVLLRTEKAGSKDHTEVVSAHLVDLLLLHHEIGKEYQQEHEDFMVHVFHISKQRTNEGILLSS
jgi:hypothetical protein